MSSLVPHEVVPEFTDDQARILYDLIQVKSEDIGFTWKTEMLMLNILCDMERADYDLDTFESSIRYYQNGDFLWERVKPHVNKIKQLVSEL